MRHRIASLLAVCILTAAPPAWCAAYKIDPDHSAVTFKIRHLFSKVSGTFNEFSGSFVYEPDHPEQWSAEAVVQTASINTRVEARDKHLRSADFFDVEKVPTMTFKSTQVTDATPTAAKLHGILTLHGVERPVILDLQILGEGKDPWGNVRAGFTAATTINRKEFGIIWNKVGETGQLLLGEDVDILLEVEGVKQ